MNLRSPRLRTRVVGLLASLVALWGFAAWVTIGDGANLLSVQTLNSEVAKPSEPLLSGLQAERRLSVVYLGSATVGHRDALQAQRRSTDALAMTFTRSVQGWRAEVAASADLGRRIDGVLAGLRRLTAARAAIDRGTVDRATAADAVTRVIDAIFAVYDSMGRLDDTDIADDTAALIDLNLAWELMSQEDALLAGVISAGRITATEHAQFAALVGAHRGLADRAVGRLPRADQSRYERLADGPAAARLTGVEDRVIQSGRQGVRPPVDGAVWDAAVRPAMAQLRALVLTGGAELVSRATPGAVWVVIRLLLATGLGLIAVIVCVVTARALVRQLERLREAARTLAQERLPDVVARLSRGEEVDLAAESPPLTTTSNDEIGQLGQAFNAVQQTALRTAADQAALRRGVRDLFLSLALRSQGLLRRQLAVIDVMERRQEDPTELEDLFRVDHLATRMRRIAENLIVLSGAKPPRAWRADIAMVDVLRGAVGEVEDYPRVTVLPTGVVALAGRAVADITHLLAELIENALSCSPPHTQVQVRGMRVARGYAIEIEDRGLGMTEQELDAANQRITSDEPFSLSGAGRVNRLGLYVVGRLARRTEVQVRLKDSPYGGVSAVVLIPPTLITDQTADGDRRGNDARDDAVGTNTVGSDAVGSDDSAMVNRAGRGTWTSTGDTLLLPQVAAAAPALPHQGGLTPRGLPRRVRQSPPVASAADTPAADTPAADTPAATPLTPDRARAVADSFQAGIRRQAADAAGQQPPTDPTTSAS